MVKGEKEKGGVKEERRLHKNLDVWMGAMGLARQIYTITGGFAKEEIYGLTSQLRRAAVSVPSNLAEGAARTGPKEFLQFINPNFTQKFEQKRVRVREMGVRTVFSAPQRRPHCVRSRKSEHTRSSCTTARVKRFLSTAFMQR